MAAVLSDSQSIIDAGINSVRRISHSMTPPGLEMFGLADALESLCQKNSTPQTNVRFDCAPNFSRLSPPQELGLYRIAQELLNNALRHAEATEIVIRLALPQEGTALFEYRDNGKGFDLEILKSRRGLGMKNIEARANYLKAKVQWQTQPGEGLKVSITLP
jgi:signal transduction histidine kinase